MSRAVNQNSPAFKSKQNLLALGKQRLDFRLSRDKVVHRETAANVCASLRTKSNFSAGIFVLRCMRKY